VFSKIRTTYKEDFPVKMLSRFKVLFAIYENMPVLMDNNEGSTAYPFKQPVEGNLC
jgi:hypothetical protein